MKLSKTVTAIRDHGVDPIANSFFANLLFHLFDSAKLDPRRTLRFLRAQIRVQTVWTDYF